MKNNETLPKIAHNKGHKYVQRDAEMYTLLYEPRIRVFPKIAHEYVQSEVHIMLRAR